MLDIAQAAAATAASKDATYEIPFVNGGGTVNIQLNFDLQPVPWKCDYIPHFYLWRYAGIVVDRFFLIFFCDTSKEGLNSPNKHGCICNLGYKFQI